MCDRGGGPPVDRPSPDGDGGQTQQPLPPAGRRPTHGNSASTETTPQQQSRVRGPRTPKRSRGGSFVSVDHSQTSPARRQSDGRHIPRADRGQRAAGASPAAPSLTGIPMGGRASPRSPNPGVRESRPSPYGDLTLGRGGRCRPPAWLPRLRRPLSLWGNGLHPGHPRSGSKRIDRRRTGKGRGRAASADSNRPRDGPSPESVCSHHGC